MSPETKPSPLATRRGCAPLRLRSRLTAAVAALALLVSGAPPAALAQQRLPALGDPASQDFSIATERKLGDAIMREIRADPDYLDDPVLLEYLQSLWQPLLEQARQRGNLTADTDTRFAWEPFLIRDRSVNAFALPAGYVGVYLGLFALTATRDELGSVLAHELSHVTQRHIARSIANSKRQTLISLAALLVGALAASRSGGGDAANAAITGGQALAMQGQLNFSRDMEREADRVGFGVMSAAGYGAGGMASMFEKLDQSSRLNDSGGFPYLRSHPLTSERIGDARARLGATAPPPPGSRLEHAVAQARARVLMDTRFDALKRWQALDSDRVATTVADRLANAYASALASTLLRDWARADASIEAALALVRGAPGGAAGAERTGSEVRAERGSTEVRAERGSTEARAERAVVLLQVQSLLARGDVARAVAALEPYRSDGSRPVLLLAAQAALAAPAAAEDNAALKQRASELRTWVATRPLDALAWTALSQVEERLGQPLRAVRADAEARVALGDLTGAIDRLNAGQRRARSGGAGDFIDASVIDARLRDVESQRRQQQADEKELR